MSSAHTEMPLYNFDRSSDEYIREESLDSNTFYKQTPGPIALCCAVRSDKMAGAFKSFARYDRIISFILHENHIEYHIHADKRLSDPTWLGSARHGTVVNTQTRKRIKAKRYGRGEKRNNFKPETTAKRSDNAFDIFVFHKRRSDCQTQGREKRENPKPTKN